MRPRDGAEELRLHLLRAVHHLTPCPHGMLRSGVSHRRRDGGQNPHCVLSHAKGLHTPRTSPFAITISQLTSVSWNIPWWWEEDSTPQPQISPPTVRSSSSGSTASVQPSGSAPRHGTPKRPRGHTPLHRRWTRTERGGDLSHGDHWLHADRSVLSVDLQHIAELDL